MTKNRKRIVEAAAGLALVVLAVAWLSGAFETRIRPGEVPGVVGADAAGVGTALVISRTESVLAWSSGTVASARQTTVAARVLARIEAVHVRAGAEVNKGDALIDLDARDFEARLSRARDMFAAAEARRDLAATEEMRARELLASGVATQQRLDTATSALRVALAELAGMARSLEEVETALSYTTIRSPVTGRVVDRLAEPGETASPGRALLHIYDPTVLRVEAPVRESLAVILSLGDVLSVELPALGLTGDGVVDEIVPYAEPGARTMLIKIRLGQSENVMAGMYARVAVPAGRRERLLVLEAAIERIGQLEFALVAGPDGRTERRLVTTGATDDEGRIEVLSGLEEGERVALLSRAYRPQF